VEYTEFKRHLGKSGLSLTQFAALIEVCPTAVTNYAAKRAVPRHYAVLAVLIGDAADRGSDFRTALARFGLHIRTDGASNVSHLEDFKRSAKSPRRNR
jgi:hypothetical protein